MNWLCCFLLFRKFSVANIKPTNKSWPSVQCVIHNNGIKIKHYIVTDEMALKYSKSYLNYMENAINGQRVLMRLYESLFELFMYAAMVMQFVCMCLLLLLWPFAFKWKTII